MIRSHGWIKPCNNNAIPCLSSRHTETSDSNVITADPDVITAFAAPDRRHVIAILSEADVEPSVSDLARWVAARQTGSDPIAVSQEEQAKTAATLRSTHLPKLVESDLVEHDTEADTVRLAEHSAFENPWVQTLYQRGNDLTKQPPDGLFKALAHERRQQILSILLDRPDEMLVSDLALYLAARNRDNVPLADVNAEAHRRVHLTLSHNHLPQLASADLIAYDRDAQTVSATPTSSDLLEQTPDEQLDGLQYLLAHSHHSDEKEIWTIDGYENVIARGQALFDRADEELFIMVTTDGLLEEDCVAGLRDAVARGVDVYVGSQTQAVRDLVRRRVPGAIIWEPQLDYLNLPPKREKLGRLVFADREAIMLGTLGEAAEDTLGYRETAITAEGADNTLVVLMRQLLGSRLDHLDSQSANFRSEIPL